MLSRLWYDSQTMGNILLDNYRSGQLHHATLLLIPHEEARRLISEFLLQLAISPADYILFDGLEPLKIKDARDIRRFVGMSTYNSPIKLIAITDARQLTAEAANALLKTLEEPPSRTYLILATTQIDALLPTIRSRCQVISTSTNSSISDLVSALTAKSLVEYFETAKEIAESEFGLSTVLEAWLQEFEHQPKKQQIIMDYLPAAQTNVNRRLLLDNLALELYTKG